MRLNVPACQVLADVERAFAATPSDCVLVVTYGFEQKPPTIQRYPLVRGIDVDELARRLDEERPRAAAAFTIAFTADAGFGGYVHNIARAWRRRPGSHWTVLPDGRRVDHLVGFTHAAPAVASVA